MSGVERIVKLGFGDVIGGFLTVAQPAIPVSEYLAWIDSLPVRRVDVLWPMQYTQDAPPWQAAGYEAMAVTTRDGRTLSGWLASESENSLTLRTAFDTEETISRQNLASYSASGVSLMPEGLEHTMTREELANVIAYLRQEPPPARSVAVP